jgi:hypothetical protein
MYHQRYAKKVDGEEYGYWSLVESVRTASGPRQRIVASIGKLPWLDKEERIGWEEIGRILTGKPHQQDNLFRKTEEPFLKYQETPDIPETLCFLRYHPNLLVLLDISMLSTS